MAVDGGQQGRAANGGAVDPMDQRDVLPADLIRTSANLGWSGIRAMRCVQVPGREIYQPKLTHHALILSLRPPEQLHVRHENLTRETPPAAGTIMVVPAGHEVRWRWRGIKDSLHVYLDPALINRAAAEEFGLDPARWTLPPLDGLDLAGMRSMMLAVAAELMSGAPGGPLVAESLGNLLAIHLLRHITGGRRPDRAFGPLARAKLSAVIEFMMENLGASPTIEQMAAIAHVSPFHFSRQFKAATGMPPHQYLIARRVERAQQLLREDRELSLADVTMGLGFSDQSHFTRHFKKRVGLTPRQFRAAATFA